MTNPIPSLSENRHQPIEAKKSVSWGGKQVTLFEPSDLIPENFSDQAKESCRALMDGCDFLAKALKSEKVHGSASTNCSFRSKSIVSLQSAIRLTKDAQMNPVMKKMFQSAHVLLARAYIGMYPAAFVREFEFLRSDPETSKKYENWPKLLQKRENLFE